MNEDDFLTWTKKVLSFFESMRKVPSWRFTFAMLFLGEDVNKNLKDLRGE